MPDTSEPFYFLMDASNTGIGSAILQQHPTEKKMNLIPTKSRQFTPIGMRFSTLIREGSTTIFPLTEYELLLSGLKHPIVFFSDHKPTIYLLTVYGFQLK